MEELKESKQILKPTEVWRVPDKPTNILIVGKPKHGKTFLTRQLINEMVSRGLVKFGVVISATAAKSGDFDFMPNGYVIDVDDAEDAMNKLKKHVAILDERCKRVGKQNMPGNFIVIDDMVGSINQYAGDLQKLYTTFRHNQTYCITCSQVIGKGTSTVLRQCAEWIFLFTGAINAGPRETKGLYEEFGGGMKQKQFEAILNLGTSQKYHALLIDTTTENSKEKFKSYKAPNKKIKKMNWK